MSRSAPLYVVAWRIVWMPLIYIGAAIAGLGILVGFGPRAFVDAVNYVFRPD